MNSIANACNWVLEKIEQLEPKDHLSHLPGDIFVEIFKYLPFESARALHLSERKIVSKTDVMIKIINDTLTQQYLEKLFFDLPKTFLNNNTENCASSLKFKKEAETYPDRSPEKFDALRKAICCYLKDIAYSTYELNKYGLDRDDALLALLIGKVSYIMLSNNSNIKINKSLWFYLNILETNQVKNRQLSLYVSNNLNDRLLKSIENVFRNNLYINEVYIDVCNLSDLCLEDVYKAVKSNQNIMQFTISDSNKDISSGPKDWLFMKILKDNRRSAFKDVLENIFKESFQIEEGIYALFCTRLC